MNRGLQAIEIARFLNMGVIEITHCSKLNKNKGLALLHIFTLTGVRTCARPPTGLGQNN